MKPLTKPLHAIMLLMLLSFTGYSGYAQVESPPSLALGVAGVIGEKGSIDVDLLAQIISEKQGELKQEFIKKTFFQGLEDHSYVLWEFSYSTLNVLLESESKDAIKKNLLEKASNLALVYGFAELYLQLSRKMCHSALDSLLRKYDKEYQNNALFSCPAGGPTELTLDTIKLYQLKKFSRKVGDEDLNFSSVFIDLMFDVLRKNQEVTKTLGFLTTPSPLGEDYYRKHSAYHRVNEIDELKAPLNSLRNRVTKEVQLLLHNFILLKKVVRSEVSLDSLVDSYSILVDKIKEKKKRAKDKVLPNTKELFDTLVTKTISVYKDLQKIQGNFVSTTPNGGNTAIVVAETANDNKELSKMIAENLAAFNNFVAKGQNFDQFDIYYLEKSIMPLLIRLVTEKGFNPEYLDVARDFDHLITYELLNKLNNTLEKGAGPTNNFSDLAQTPLANFAGLLDFITRLDELDKVETYQFVLQTIQTVGEMYNDRKLGVYLKTIVENINTYTVLNEEEKKVEIAVEDIITRIYERFGNRQSKIFSLYFSIGLNQSLDSDFKYQQLLPNGNDTTRTLNSVGFASEKIGLKIKIWDIKWRRSFTVGETYHARLTGKGHTVTEFRSNKPLVSDVYFVTYLSGLLYNVANLATSEEFNDPIAGVGIGVAFFNSLDLNIGYNWPLGTNSDFFGALEKQRIITIGFDVKITEYLSALGKKRKAKS